MPAIKNSLTCASCAKAATMSMTMRPKISMGSMPVWPQLCALMMVVTKVNSVTMTAGTGPRSSTMAMITAMAAAPKPMIPASSLREPEMSDCSSVSVELSAARPRTIPATCGRMSLRTTATPKPIMRPIPRDLTMPCAVITSNRPAAVPPTMMPKLPSSAPANQNATGAKPTRKPTESSMGEL